jgi:flagellar basal body rod protein FlgG
VFAAPIAKPPLHAPQTVPLRLSGALGNVAVTSANATAPRVIALVKVAQFQAPTILAPTGNTVFQSTGGQWLCNLSTAGLSPGTYVVQIQFWDGRILEAAFQIN